MQPHEVFIFYAVVGGVLFTFYIWLFRLARHMDKVSEMDRNIERQIEESVKHGKGPTP